MDPKQFNDEELLGSIQNLRERLDRCEREIDAGETDTSRETLRGLMTEFNLLKIEARRRGFRDEQL